MDYIKVSKTSRLKSLGQFFTGPLIWFPLVVIILLDVLVSVYQAVCFPIYGIEKVKRSKFILIMDRTKLQYLTGFEKVCCMYCGYGNGALLYFKEIAGLTEKYWCGIMHENKKGFKKQPSQVKLGFAKFNDKEDFNKKYGPGKY